MSKGYRMPPSSFFYVHITFFESSLYCVPVLLLISCSYKNNLSKVVYVVYVKNEAYHFASVCHLSVCLSVAPSFLRLCMTGCFVSLSSYRVQRTAGTSCKAWCRTSPLNPPRPPLHRDRLAPGKVRLPHWTRSIESHRLSSPMYFSSVSHMCVSSSDLNLKFRCCHVSVLFLFKTCVGVNVQSCSHTYKYFLW